MSRRRRLVLAWLLVLLLRATPAAAQVTLDAATTVGDTATNTATTVSHTTGASGTWMAVWAGSTSGFAGGGASVSTITFGATSLALRCSILQNTNLRMTLFDGTVPAGTTATVTVTWSGNNSNAVVAVTSWNAVVGVGACVTTGVASGTSITSNVSSLSTDLVVDGIAHGNSATTCTVGAGQTTNFVDFEDGAAQIKGEGSRETGAAGSTTMSWSACAGGTRIVQAAYPLQSVLPPPLVPGSLLLLGVGR